MKLDLSASSRHPTPLALVGSGYRHLPNRAPRQIVFAPDINDEVGESGFCCVIEVLNSCQSSKVSVKRDNIIESSFVLNEGVIYGGPVVSILFTDVLVNRR